MNHPLDHHFDQFLKERRFLENVTDATLVWFRVAFTTAVCTPAFVAAGGF